MDTVWTKGAMTVRDVLCHLNRSPAPGYTTVATIMMRLVDKGLLGRARSGRADVYEPLYDRSEFDRRTTSATIARLVDTYGDLALTQFAVALDKANPDWVVRLRTQFALATDAEDA